ncbi:hypothetical protein DL546_007746 [Coniochaeta pulveracea]|uniref:RING-type domain-containing protein n=1 Tax=Coniochaeta pulveracea TaxID=177199 RepID=A0A420YNL4_9PEZI|nr:hypothetical protein DL546_007746 [Coniochaeta pulveracea]
MGCVLSLETRQSFTHNHRQNSYINPVSPAFRDSFTLKYPSPPLPQTSHTPITSALDKMCREFEYRFGGCTHTVRQRQQCVLGYCATPLDVTGYAHTGECPECLGGAFYPYESHIRTDWLTGYTLDTIQPFYQSVAQYLLRFSVTWLVGGYDAARAGSQTSLPLPLPGRERFPAHIHEEVLRQFYAQTACIECGRVSFLESGICNQCPGKTQEGTINPATQFLNDVTKDVYRRKYLPRVEAGELRKEQARIKTAFTPDTLGPEAAAMLIHRTSLNEDKSLARLDGFYKDIHDLELEFDAATTDDAADPHPKGRLSHEQRICYGDFSVRVMYVAAWVLAHDAGISDGVGKRVLRYLAPMLIHRMDSLRPAQWEIYRVDTAALDFSSYHAVAEAYMELQGDGPVAAFTTVMADMAYRFATTITLLQNEMADLRMTRERLITARVSLHSDVVSQPPEDCPICYGSFCEEDSEMVKYHRCGHVAHTDCIVQGLLAASRQTCFYCRQHYGGPDESPSDTSLNGFQDAPWDFYGL